MPQGALVRGPGGVLYGVTFLGGANITGTVFRVTEAGVLTTIASMPAGAHSEGGVTLGSDGNLYVMSLTDSSVYKVAPDGSVGLVTTLTGPGGERGGLDAPMLEVGAGVFYGVAPVGAHNMGEVFRLVPAPSPVVTIIGSFGPAGGANPRGLIRASGGGFYGVTTLGGDSAYGTVFKLSAAGVLFTVRSFTQDDISPAPLSSGLADGFERDHLSRRVAAGERRGHAESRDRRVPLTPPTAARADAIRSP